jgi:hypothetical protein
MTLVRNTLHLLRSMTDEYLIEGAQIPKDIDDIISNIILFSAIYGIGGPLNE